MYQYLEIRIDESIQALIQKSPDRPSYFELSIQNLERKHPIVAAIHKNLSRPNDNYLVFKVQLQPYSPHDLVPLSLLHEGTVCEISLNLRQNKLGTARVLRRWFEPVTSHSWKLIPFPERYLRKLKVKQHFSTNEFRRIQLGSIPLSMDDHWFAYFEDDWLYWHRSYSGNAVFKLHIEEWKGEIMVTEALHNPAGWPLSLILPAQLLNFLMKWLCSEAIVFD